MRQPDVRLLLLATLLARLAGRMFALVIVLYALARTGSPGLAGWLAFAAVAPGLLVSPIAGALIDAVGAAWAVGVDMAASAACVAALVVVDWAGIATPPVLLALTAGFSLTSPLSFAGIRALLPRLVPPSALGRVNAMDTAIHGVTDVTGPALAGAMFGLAGPRLVLCVMAAIYAAAACCVGARPTAMHGLPRAAPLLTQAWRGLRLVLGEPTLRGLALAYSLYEVCWGILVVAVPVAAASRYPGGAGAAVAGLLWAGLGLVGGCVALLVGRLHTLGRERRLMAVGMAVTAAAVWPVAAEFGLPGLAVGLMLVGAAAGPVDVGVLTLRQRRTDPAVLGRVISVSMSLNLAGGPLGSALGGLLVTWSLPAALAVAALAALLAAAAVRLIPPDEARS